MEVNMRNNVLWDVTSPDYTSSHIRRLISSRPSLSAATNEVAVHYSLKDAEFTALFSRFHAPRIFLRNS